MWWDDHEIWTLDHKEGRCSSELTRDEEEIHTEKEVVNAKIGELLIKLKYINNL
jgi:hypothetical protein